MELSIEMLEVANGKQTEVFTEILEEPFFKHALDILTVLTIDNRRLRIVL